MKVALDFPFVRTRLENSLSRVNNVRITDKTLRLSTRADFVTAMRIDEGVRWKLETGNRKRRRMQE